MTTLESLLRNASRILLITHVAPDGDAIGGLLGLGKALRDASKTVTVSCSEPVPKRFAYLPGYADIVHQTLGPFDLVVALDCGDLKRVGSIYRADEWHDIPFLNIDHHVTNTRFGTHNWVEPKCVATSEMVLELCNRLSLPLDADIAKCLLYGIISDTLGLRTDNVTPALVGKVMLLMQAGAPLAEIVDQAFNRRPVNLLRAWEKALATMRLEEGVIWASLTRQARQEAGWSDTDLQGLVTFLLAAEEASLSAVLVEKDDGQVEVGLRARPPFDVSGVALALGGGGHPQASGCTIDGPMEMAVGRVVAALKSLIPNLHSQTLKEPV
jgi:bifunctional oligoribonuclease and PAP phosphatase NrnA